MKNFLLSKTFLWISVLIYVIFVHNVASAWAKLSGEFSYLQLLFAYLFYGAVFMVLLAVRHHYRIKNNFNNISKNGKRN